MGERADNLLQAWDGLVLDWDALLGAGFRRPPRGWVSVYRECSFEELVRIARQGLHVPPAAMRPSEIRREMEILDRFRPADAVNRGVCRERAIYAVPAIEDVPRLPFRRERVILELKVDPAESFVGDMNFITCLIPFIDASRGGLERFQGAFRQYWDSVMPLADFRKNYERVEHGGAAQWIRRARRGAARLPQVVFSPEILVMTPVISRRHVRVVRADGLIEDEPR